LPSRIDIYLVERDAKRAKLWEEQLSRLVKCLSKGEIEPHFNGPFDSSGFALKSKEILGLVSAETKLKSPAVIVADVNLIAEKPDDKAPLIAVPDPKKPFQLVVGTSTSSSWARQWNLPVILRAIFLAALKIKPECKVMGCIANGHPEDEITGLARVAVCPQCRKKHSKEYPLLDKLANWLNKNRGDHFTIKNLKTASLRRLPDLREEFGDALEVNTKVLLALAEENPPNEPTKLPDDPKNACAEIFKEAVRKWRPRSPDLHSALDDLLGGACEIDALAYLTQKRHREHAEHCLAVGLLSQFILSVRFPRSEELFIERCCDKFGKNREPKDMRGAMWVAAALHDIGYPLCHYLHALVASASSPDLKDTYKHLKKLGETIFAKPYPVHWDVIKEIAEAAPEKLLDKAYSAVVWAIEKMLPNSPFRKHYLNKTIPTTNKDARWKIFDHGLWSLWVIAKFLEAKDQHKPYTDGRLARHAAEAVAFHNMPIADFTAKKKIDLLSNPILFLLRLCDTAQEWDRSILTKKGLRTELHRVLLTGIYRPIGMPAEFYGDELVLHLEYSDEKPIADSKWDYEIAVSMFRKYLHTLSFPNRWKDCPKRVGFQIRSPIYTCGGKN